MKMIEITFTTRCDVEDCMAETSEVQCMEQGQRPPEPNVAVGWSVVDGADLCPEHAPATVLDRQEKRIIALEEEVEILSAALEERQKEEE